MPSSSSTSSTPGGAWLSREAALDLGDSCLAFCQAYSNLAQACFDHNLSHFSLVPSLHYFHHFYMDVRRHFADPAVAFMLSPAIANCEGDEDFIGKISRFSRHVHPVITIIRTIQRYLVRMHFVMEDGEV